MQDLHENWAPDFGVFALNISAMAEVFAAFLAERGVATWASSLPPAGKKTIVSISLKINKLAIKTK